MTRFRAAGRPGWRPDAASDGDGDPAGPVGGDTGDRDPGVCRVLSGDRAGRRDADLAPDAGQLISQGQALYRTGDGEPVVLLYGSVPDWRALEARLGAVNPPGSLTLGQAVFKPEALRVAQVTGRLGGPANGPVMTATSGRQVVTILPRRAPDRARQRERRAALRRRPAGFDGHPTTIYVRTAPADQAVPGAGLTCRPVD